MHVYGGHGTVPSRTTHQRASRSAKQREQNVSTPAPPSPSGNLPSVVADELPEIIHRSGANATFAAQEFFFGTVRNEHTRRAYLHAVRTFLDWIEKHGGGELTNIAP